MKKYIIFLLILVISALCGCTILEEPTEPTEPPEPTLSVEEIEKEENAVPRIGFSTTDSNIEEIFTVEELRSWQNPYEKYRSCVMFDTLSETEKTAYRAIEYAMANCYQYTYFDYRLGISVEDAEEAVRYLALDSPLLEQNLFNVAYRSTEFYDKTLPDGSVIKIMNHGACVSVKNFRKDLWDQKLIAVEEAEKILASLNLQGTQAENAEAIYRYVAQNTTYDPYKTEFGSYTGDLASFLYDTIVNKESHCDGFTNALALFFELAGFEQVEKIGDGHTWNCVKIDGTWYNCDATAGSFIPADSDTRGAGLFFAYADYLQNSKPLYRDKYPVCEEGLYMQADGFLSSEDDDDFFDALYDGLADHDYEWSFVILDSFDYDNAEYTLRQVVYYTDTSLMINYFDVIDGKTVLLIYAEDYI